MNLQEHIETLECRHPRLPPPQVELDNTMGLRISFDGIFRQAYRAEDKSVAIKRMKVVKGGAMPHVTFIHGIGNKPGPEQLSRAWLGTLADHGVDLNAWGISSSFVYWADFLYRSPVKDEVDYESVTEVEDASVPDVGMRWIVEAEGEDAALIKRLAATIGFQELSGDEPVSPAAAGAAEGFERVPLPPWLKRRLMKIFLRDVHHYLFDTEFSPRAGETYKIRNAIRERACEVLSDGAGRESPHVLVTHSMGTVIAYDCLKRVPDCPAVDALLTIGSPLGLDEIQDGLKPQWSRSDGFPGERLRGRWVNIYDQLDPVAGFDPDLAYDYQRAGVSAVEDYREDNWGRWRHSISKYFAGKTLQAKLTELLS